MTAAASTATGARVPHEERTLAATVVLLVEQGFARTAATSVSQRAGVSRGAQLHHLSTKNALVVAAVEHLTEGRGAGPAAAPAARPGGERRILDQWARTLDAAFGETAVSPAGRPGTTSGEVPPAPCATDRSTS